MAANERGDVGSTDRVTELQVTSNTNCWTDIHTEDTHRWYGDPWWLTVWATNTLLSEEKTSGLKNYNSVKKAKQHDSHKCLGYI